MAPNNNSANSNTLLTPATSVASLPPMTTLLLCTSSVLIPLVFLPIFIEHAALEICDSETSCLPFLTTFILKVWKTVLKCRWHPLTNFVALSKPFNHSVTQCLHFKMGSQDLSGIVIGKMKDNVGRAHQNLSINESG